MKTSLPVGLYEFHKNKFFNIQLNRWYSLGYTRLEDIQKVAAEIKTLSDYKSVFVSLAESAIKENRLKNAAFYYRAAEFFVKPSDPDKLVLYDKFSDVFYQAFSEDHIERHKVAYENSFLPAMRLAPSGRSKKGTIVIHGGFDSFIEEFYCIWKYFSESGYEVIAFEGPGQGGALRKYNLLFDHRWEKPAKVVLDYFNLTDVTLIGISMGGYWCLRAAAFERRIRRVISFPPLYDWLEMTSAATAVMVKLMMKWKWLMNTAIRIKMKVPIIEHVVNQILFITRKEEPIEAGRWLLEMNKEDLHSDLITQDVLLLAGEADAFQPPVLYHKQMKALTHAKSVTGRVFTKAEHGENHCQIGNIGLALDVMLAWIEGKS